jgi:LCP family protein required for cell wall assembly
VQPPRGRQQSAAPQRHRLRTAFLIAFGFLFAGVCGTGAFYYPVAAAAYEAAGHRASALTHPRQSPQTSPGTATGQAGPNAANTGQAFTVLLLGSDDDQKFSNGNLLTQSMILVRVDPGAKKVTMLSIPRDLYVPLASGGYGKIMEAYSEGQAQDAIQTVEQDFGIQVDQYVWIGLQGLVNVINDLGGVDVASTNPLMDDQYPNDVGTSNPYSVKRLAVLPGPQHMTGEQALEYVRSRHSDPRGDFGRSFRQQQVLEALRAKAKQVNPAELPSLAQAMSGQIQTSMGVGNIQQLLPLATELNSSDITQVVLVGNYTTDTTLDDGEDALIPNWTSILPLVHEYFPATG